MRWDSSHDYSAARDTGSSERQAKEDNLCEAAAKMWRMFVQVKQQGWGSVCGSGSEERSRMVMSQWDWATDSTEGLRKWRRLPTTISLNNSRKYIDCTPCLFVFFHKTYAFVTPAENKMARHKQRRQFLQGVKDCFLIWAQDGPSSVPHSWSCYS